MDLITLTEYKQAKNLTSTKEDERISSLVSAVSQLVKTYCGQSFVDYYAETLTEYYSVDLPCQTIQLNQFPVVEIQKISERVDPTAPYTELTSEQFILNRRTDTVTRCGGAWPSGVESVEVLYKSGYAETPGEIKLACIDIVHYYLKEEYKVSRSTKGSSISSTSSSSLKGNLGFPDHIKRVLDMYRQV